MDVLMLTIVFLSLVLLFLTPWLKIGSLLTIASLFGYFYFSNVTDWLPISLLILGIILITLEIFIPRFGLLGIVGFLSTISGLYLTTGDLLQTIAALSVALLTSSILIIVLIRNGFSFKNWDIFVLDTKISGKNEHKKSDLKVGMIGVTTTPLRPSGKVKFNEQPIVYDVLSVEGHINQGTKVIIQEIYGTKIIVQKYTIE